MRRSFVAMMVLASTVALAQGEPGSKPSKGARKKAPAELDVSRMPFSPDSIQQVMIHHKGKIQACYEDTMAEKDKKVEGKLMTSFTITASGLVKDAKVLKKGTTLKDSELHDCVVAVLTALTFPQPPDGMDHPIEYPFNLKAIE
ncbi:AgmX/PglI C-terminal domain-containing protein [Hyalangium rubrum]|uniref:AgmX/PglI C-terminal domain-containing protein n=1 Tax=Hyalangium rubrum TaxID=3103134 RepID=A0ABU5HCW6_9BACT|nr:AgmX/PglI C-terminal domain-containing protein [Hyalangium sp. s54d21]MDY7231105.1 AgmX/PglI C-terminal domain-containing protein [Hyalangium sp. s54d21]